MAIFSIPSSIELENVMLNSYLNWSTYQQFTQIHPQSEEFFIKKNLAIHRLSNESGQYLSIEKQSIFVKCRVIVGLSGCSKSF